MERMLKDVSTILDMYKTRRINANQKCSMSMINNLYIQMVSTLKSSLNVDYDVPVFEVPEVTEFVYWDDNSLTTCIRNVKGDLNQENYKCLMYHIYEKWVRGEHCPLFQFKSSKFNKYTIHTIGNTDHILLIESSNRKDVSTILNMYKRRRYKAGKKCSVDIISKLSKKLMSALKCTLSNDHNISLFEVPEHTTLFDLEEISLATCIRNVKDKLNWENYTCIMYNIYEKWVRDEDCSILKFKRTKFNKYTIHTISSTDHIVLIEPSSLEKNKEELNYLRDPKAIEDLINSDPTLSDMERKEYAEIIYKERQQETLSLKRKRKQIELNISSAKSSPYVPPTLHSPPAPSNTSIQLIIEDDFVNKSDADSDTTVNLSDPIHTDLENIKEGVDYVKIVNGFVNKSDADSVSTVDLSSPIHIDLENNTEGVDSCTIENAIVVKSDVDSVSAVDLSVSLHSDIVNNTYEVDNIKISKGILHLINSDPTLSDSEWNDYAEIINKELGEQGTTKRKANESLNDEKETVMVKGSEVFQTKTEASIKKENPDFETDCRTNQFNQLFQHLNMLSQFARQQRESQVLYLIEEIRKELQQSQTKN